MWQGSCSGVQEMPPMGTKCPVAAEELGSSSVSPGQGKVKGTRGPHPEEVRARDRGWAGTVLPGPAEPTPSPAGKTLGQLQQIMKKM